MVTDPPGGEIPRGFPPPVGTVDDGNGPQTSMGWYMDVPTHCVGAGNGIDGCYWVVYCPPPEHGCKEHCNSSYRGIVSDGGAESGTANSKAVVGATRSVYPGDKSGVCIRGGGWGGGGTGMD